MSSLRYSLDFHWSLVFARLLCGVDLSLDKTAWRLFLSFAPGLHANIGLLLLQMDKDSGNALFKYSRGKRIAQMCLNETSPDLSNTSSSMADIVNSYAFEEAGNSSGSLTLLDLDTVIPNDKVVLTPTKYSDVQAIGHGCTLRQSNTNNLPLHPLQSSSKPSSSVPILATDINDDSCMQANTYCFPSDTEPATVSATSSDFLLMPTTNPGDEVFEFNVNRHEEEILQFSTVDDIQTLQTTNLQEMGLTEVENVDIEMIDADCLQDITNNEPLVPYSSTDSDGELPIKSKSKNKKTKVDRKTWFAEKNKSLRENGQKYYGRVKTDSKWTYEKEKEPRNMKERCKCKESKGLKCQEIKEKTREEIFTKFWKKLTWGEKKVYVNEHVQSVQIKRPRGRKNSEESRRTQSLVYYLTGDEDAKLRVCRTMFLNTLNIGRMTVHGWKNNMKTNRKPQEQRVALQSVNPHEEKQKNLIAFFDALPVMESHYCRSSTSRVYLLPEWQTKKSLYNFYETDWCSTRNSEPLSSTVFFKVMEERKISLFRPKKDECEKCANYKQGNVEETEYRLHMERKDDARKEKANDKDSDNCVVFAVDTQAVLLCPVSKVSVLYYKTKLQVHNLCFKNLKNKDAYSYLWNECEGGMNAEEFASIWVDFLEKNVIPNLPDGCNRIIFYSDGCGYQNRNAVMSNALLNTAAKHNLWIEQKYLEVGHTQMEVDSMHSAIERRLKNKVINVPADYIDVIKTARKEPYYVQYLSHKFFKKFDTVQSYKSIRPGRSVGDAKVNDIRALQYSPIGIISYKLRFAEPWSELPQRKATVNPKYYHELESLHENQLPIKDRKFQDLQQIKLVLPRDYRDFYDNLPH